MYKRIVSLFFPSSPESGFRAERSRALYRIKGGFHARNYHLTLDSGVLGISKCVEIIAELF